MLVRGCGDENSSLKHWVAYPVLLVLVVTAVLQVNYVDKSRESFTPLPNPALTRTDLELLNFFEPPPQCKGSNRASWSRCST